MKISSLVYTQANLKNQNSNTSAFRGNLIGHAGTGDKAEMIKFMTILGDELLKQGILG